MGSVTNVSSTFLLLGLVEMEKVKHLYWFLSFIVYGFIMLLNSTIVFLVLTDRSLHEPMYIFISSLILNEIFGSSSFFPKLLIDLLMSTKTISLVGCLVQSYCLLFCAYMEIANFTLMAYDRFLAVCHPLRYRNLMTNEMAVKLIIVCLIFSVTAVSIGIMLTARLYFCGNQIQNIFCDKMSLVILSCGDTTLNKVHGESVWSTYLSLTTSVIVFSYLKVYFICVKLSKESRKKAVHTVMTHIISFSVFMMGILFVFIRYRLNGHKLPVTAHNIISVVGLVTPLLFNPLIYGIRTKALKVKLIQHLQKLHLFPTIYGAKKVNNSRTG
ncbi:olfactory receptor 49-like [Bufo gargarizans]|uniref:olfactory receptor 49-like n=1 Tax=Bufo gargarizans TaxID=30331 RepID=UPI001CF3AB30|nr:olfactory receptor 49-like [Bufo gargarizans]